MTFARASAALVATLFVPFIANAQSANAKAAPGSPTADRLPIYEVDPTWPPTLPHDWILGDIRGLFVDDRDHQRVWILRRKDLAILDRFGKPGRQAGEFIRAHMIAIDSKNRMYTGEAGNGRRMQRWILKGTSPASSVTPPVQEQ